MEPKRARSGLWGLAFGVAAAIPPMLFILVAPLITGESVGDDDIERQTLAGVLWRVGVRVLVGTALPEEIIFRGLLFALWQRAGGTGAAVIATSIAFGLWHAVISFGSVSSGGAGDHATIVGIAYVATLVGLTAGGALLAVMRWRTGSIAAPVVFHWTFNGLLIVTAWLRA
jgi:membrane protease YdiL (CAAX protease family)